METAVCKFSARIGGTVAALGLALMSVTASLCRRSSKASRYVPHLG